MRNSQAERVTYDDTTPPISQGRCSVTVQLDSGKSLDLKNVDAGAIAPLVNALLTLERICNGNDDPSVRLAPSTLEISPQTYALLETFRASQQAVGVV